MRRIVNSEQTDGKIVSVLKDNMEEAHRLCVELWSKGINAWIESMKGQRLRSMIVKDPSEGLSNAPRT